MIRSNLYKRKICKKQAMKRLIDEFKQVYGGNPVVVYGDWSDKKQIKNKRPALTKGIKREMKKNFKMIMMDEYNTSKICCETYEPLTNLTVTVDLTKYKKGKKYKKKNKWKEEVEKKKVKNKIKKKEQRYKVIKVHSILESKIHVEFYGQGGKDETVKIKFYNRDKNAVNNYKRVVEAKRQGRERPKELCCDHDLVHYNNFDRL